MKREEFIKQFTEDRDTTGRYMVTSYRTGKRYFIEPIGANRMADWGSYNPGTGNIENKKGAGKFRGSIDEKDSMLTAENGFPDAVTLGVGESPESYISRVDATYPDKE